MTRSREVHNMFRFDRLRRPLAVFGLLALLLAPLPAPAHGEESPSTGDTWAGVVFATICGASISINRFVPGVPIVVVVGAVSCFGMLADAMASPDAP